MVSTILLALDGSDLSLCGGRIALVIARTRAAKVLAVHAYSAQLHNERFRDMEPGLPARYRQAERLKGLRDAHGELIVEGFEGLSQGYIEPFLEQAKAAGVEAEGVAVAGRNYVQILALAAQRQADLVVLGANGLGAIDDGMLGSTASQVLRGATCDVLIVRRDLGSGGVLVGIDGSAESTDASTKAAAIAAGLDKPLELAAVYDPVFHTHIFKTLAHSLSTERQEKVGLAEQEGLHDELINDGLATLYGEYLDHAAAMLGDDGPPHSKRLLEGKPYRALADHAEGGEADLVVVGRFGHHREAASDIGSNADALVRAAKTNVLVTTSGKPVDESKRLTVEQPETKSVDAAPTPLAWDADVEARLQRIPPFARPMAKRAIENAAREAGESRVTLARFEAVARQFGMGGGDG